MKSPDHYRTTRIESTFVGLLTLLFFMLSGTSLSGQQQSPVEAILDVETQKDRIKIEALCRNNTNQQLALRYQLSSSRIDANNNQNSNNQGSSFVLEPGGQAALSSQSMNLGKGARINVTLEIFRGEKLVARETYLSSDQKGERKRQ